MPLEVFRHASLFTRFALLVGVSPLVAGVLFALRPTDRSLALMRPLSLAGIFAAVSNLFVGVANALMAISRVEAWDASGIRFAAEMMSEVVIPTFIGFAILTIAWLCIAVGTRRLNRS